MRLKFHKIGSQSRRFVWPQTRKGAQEQRFAWQNIKNGSWDPWGSQDGKSEKFHVTKGSWDQRFARPVQWKKVQSHESNPIVQFWSRMWSGIPQEQMFMRLMVGQTKIKKRFTRRNVRETKNRWINTEEYCSWSVLWMTFWNWNLRCWLNMK